jgi:hypothetical protein
MNCGDENLRYQFVSRYRICGSKFGAMLSAKLCDNPWNIDVSHPKPSWLGPKS